MATFFPANIPLVNYFFYNYTLTTGGPNLPLAGGKVFFFADEDHDLELPTYSDVSDPNNPVVNTDPIVLNAVGACPLFYTEDRLYYIVITGPDGDLDDPIWTFEHVDFSGGAGSSGANVTNYIPNGQFLLHNDLPATDVYDAGEIRAPITNIAYGGWTFERPADSTATDIVTFERYDEWSANPPANPRWALRVQCTEADSGDAYKDIRVTFPNVNRFASATQEYTFAISGMDNFAGDAPVDLYLIKNFGTGGDTSTATLLTTFNLTPTESNFYYAFTFGTNADKVIGTGDDDYVQLAIRLRTDEELDLSITDCQLQSGNLLAPAYPETTERQDVAAGLGGGFPVPNPDGSDLYLTPRLTANGWVYDDSEIGDLISETQLSVYVNSLHPTTNRLLPDGKQYEKAGYSPLGIPFSRLWSKYWDEEKGYPSYGTGADYLTMLVTDLAGRAQDFLFTNKPGAVTDTADGTPATGFGFIPLYTGNDTFNVKGLFLDSGGFYIWNNLIGTTFGTTGPGDSGFTVTQIVNSTAQRAVTLVVAIVPATLAGKYFQFGNTTTQYYVWFTVDGVGANPAPGGTGIEVKLFSSMTANDVHNAVCGAINGQQGTLINFTSGATVPAGAYFSLYTVDVDYYVWYKVGGAGTDPAPGGKVAIGPVEITVASTNTEVSLLTQEAINSKFFAVPDPRGMFPRFFDNGAGIDPNTNIRWSTNPYNYGDIIGTSQFGEIQRHDHDFSYDYAGAAGTAIAGGAVYGDETIDSATGATGGNETRPINFNVNAAIRY